MSIKRFITAVIGLPIVIAVLAFSNKYIIDILLACVGVIAMHEYIKCAANKEIKVIKWISYLSVLAIAFIHLIPNWLYTNMLVFSVPIILLILFFHVIVTNMKITFEDVAFTLLGIIYVFSFLAFLAAIFGIEGTVSGKKLIWYVFLAAWGTDTLAYLVGIKFGKTKFSKVSPKKSVEGAIGGVVGAVLLNVLLLFVFKKFFFTEETGLSYIAVIFLSIVLSIVSMFGDLGASTIKRNFGIKDFGKLLPGHGGIMDRFDSVLFVMPVLYSAIYFINAF